MLLTIFVNVYMMDKRIANNVVLNAYRVTYEDCFTGNANTIN